MKEVVEKLITNKETIAIMESCTGGSIASAITNIDFSSSVLKFSAVTYSNEYKIKMGVLKETIEKYSVYSMEVAKEMAFNISKFSNSTYGVGITGKINRIDENNMYGEDDKVYISIYNRNKNIYYEIKADVLKNKKRKENKDYLINIVRDKLLEIIE